MEKKWTGKSRSNNFLQFLLRLTVRTGGAKAAYFFLCFVSFIYTLLPSILKSSSYYLKRRFPKDNFFRRFYRTYFLNFTFGKILIDKTIFGIKGKIKLVCLKQDIEKARSLAQDKGLIMLTAHCGCWQSAMSAFDFIDNEKFAVYKKEEGDIDKHSFELSGKQAPVKFIDPSQWDGGGLSIMSALSKKAVVCIMGDRTFGEGKNCAFVDFLGGKIEIPLMPYRIAAALSIPIMAVFFPYRDGGVDSYIVDVFYIKDKGHKIKNYIEDGQKFADCLSKFTQKYPYQFYNYFNMWR